MHACMLAYTFYESDNRVRRYAETLTRRGDKVDVVALRSSSNAKTDVINNVRVFRIQERVPNETGPLSHLTRLIRFFLRSMFFLAARELREHYDLIHVHSVPDFEVFAAWFAKLRGAKLILDIHDLVPEFYASKFKTGGSSRIKQLLILIERFSAGFADHVIAANHLWGEKLSERSVKDGKCTTILNYPDRSIFSRCGRTRRDQKFIMLYPGTLNYHQGLDIAIRALARIKDQVPHSELHIYGVGDQLNYLLSLTSDLGLEGRVQFRKVVPLTEMARIMENADVGIVPKRTDGFGNEAFSTKILEFMALGVPVIISDSTIDRYYFNDSVVKFFHGNDDEDLAKSMLDLIHDPWQRESQVKHANEFIKKFDWDVRKHEYLELVDTLVRSA